MRGTILVLALLAGACALHAEKYAVVIGAGKYPYVVNKEGKHAADLDGARPDAEAMAEMLSTRYGFSRQNITLLLDEQATRAHILQALDSLAARVHGNDRVVVYYSGHGTSGMDSNGGFGMGPATGAIIPADLKPGTTEMVLAQIVIGKRDLRPRLEAIERKADVLVIFDSCFSGESVKSILPASGPALRYLSLADLTEGAVSSRSLELAQKSGTRSAAADFPYRRVVYISAAANNQVAYDLSKRLLEALHGRFTTVDGMPHGALTNALLSEMQAEAGASAAQRGICLDFFDKVKGIVLAEAGMIQEHQDPQLLFPPSDQAIVQRPCFESTGAAEPPQGPPAAPPGEVRTELERLVSGADGALTCQLDKTGYRDGDRAVIECEIPEAGFVSVVSYGDGDPSATLLLPNRVQADAAVQPGRIRIPSSGSWHIANGLPRGMERQQNLFVVLFSKYPIELKSLNVPAGNFADVNASGFRSFRSSRAVPAYKAAKLEFVLTR